MNLPTIIVSAIIAAISVLIIVREIINKKKGKSSCSCGGSCDTCGMGCHQNKNTEN